MFCIQHLAIAGKSCGVVDTTVRKIGRALNRVRYSLAICRTGEHILMSIPKNQTDVFDGIVRHFEPVLNGYLTWLRPLPPLQASVHVKCASLRTVLRRNTQPIRPPRYDGEEAGRSAGGSSGEPAG